MTRVGAARRSNTAALVILALVIALPAHAQDSPIGFVKRLSGTVTVLRRGTVVSAVPAMPVYRADWLLTGADGELGVTFRDDTRIALGPNSRLHLKHFVFRPAELEYGFILRLVYGTLEFISGLTAKLAPDAISIETPVYTVGVRGTRVLVRAE